jgi:uncharacterized RDD family membrane protein YckC
MSEPRWLPPVPPERAEQPVPPWRAPAAPAPRTGEPPAYALPAASWWSRVAATLLDGLIVAVVAFAITIVVAAAGGGGTAARSAAAAAFFGVALLYAPLLLATNEGRTIGKQALSIRVVRNDGSPPDWRTAIMRELVLKGIFGFIGIALFIDVLVPLFDGHQRALHDMACSTRVVSDIKGY